MDRKEFIRHTAAISGGMIMGQSLFAAERAFPVVRVAESERKFRSPAIEAIIKEIETRISNKELAWLFNNCFPNTLDTTVEYSEPAGVPDTYVITGDIDAMWQRDSTAQVWPYLPFAGKDPALRKLIAGVVNRQTRNTLYDPYANAFYKDHSKVSEWKDDLTDMKPGIHERKWEIDSLCYPVRLAHGYWKATGDTSVFTPEWKAAAELIIRTFREQQRKEGQGPYHFQRRTSWATDGVPLGGYGYPAKPVGMIYSMFRPSDDATVFPFFIPGNFFALVSLEQIAQIAVNVYHDQVLAQKARALAGEVRTALQAYGATDTTRFGRIYAFEVNAMGSRNIMDDANVPSLLSLPYLGALRASDPVYLNTRKFIFSEDNPFYFKGKAAAGVGGPHSGIDMIWPLSFVMRAMTSKDDQEIALCLRTLQQTHAGTGFIHESFHKDDASRFTRKWFAWANTLFGELILKVYRERPALLKA